MITFGATVLSRKQGENGGCVFQLVALTQARQTDNEDNQRLLDAAKR